MANPDGNVKESFKLGATTEANLVKPLGAEENAQIGILWVMLGKIEAEIKSLNAQIADTEAGQMQDLLMAKKSAQVTCKAWAQDLILEIDPLQASKMMVEGGVSGSAQ